MNQIQFQAPIGTIALTWNSRGAVVRVDWYETRPGPCRIPELDPSVPASIARFLEKLKSYFTRGEPLGSIPWEFIDSDGWSAFQKKVYRAVASIPHGETRTYAWVAMRIGTPAASRAVGQALRRNPIPVLVPCHRVVSTAALGGFMGVDDPGEPEIQLKTRLIQLEECFKSPMFVFAEPSLSMGTA